MKEFTDKKRGEKKRREKENKSYWSYEST